MAIECGTTAGRTDGLIERQRLIRVSADAAILLLLFSTAFTSWMLAAVAGALFVALVLYAWFSLRGQERSAFVRRAVAAGVIAAGIAAVAAIVLR